MSVIPKNPFYVSAIGDRVWIRSLDLREPDQSLNAMPSWAETGLWYIPFDTKADIPALLMKLRDQGLPFLEVPHGWPPAAIFRKLFKEGKVTGNYSTIAFLGDGTFEIEDNK